jgi:hypothetical protein
MTLSLLTFVWIARNKRILQNKLPRINSDVRDGKETRCPLNRRLGEPQCWSVRFAEGKNILHLPGFKTWAFQLVGNWEIFTKFLLLNLSEDRSRWWYNIKLGPKDIVWEDMEWMHLTQDGVRFGATLNMLMNRVTGRGYSSCATVC